MPSIKKDLKITIEMNGKKFSLNCAHGLWGQYRIKNGRSWSEKTPTATLTEIFDLCRKWAVKTAKQPTKINHPASHTH